MIRVHVQSVTVFKETWVVHSTAVCYHTKVEHSLINNTSFVLVRITEIIHNMEILRKKWRSKHSRVNRCHDHLPL